MNSYCAINLADDDFLKIVLTILHLCILKYFVMAVIRHINISKITTGHLYFLYKGKC